MRRETRDTDQREGRRPSDSEQLVGETAASESLTDRRGVQPGETATRGGERGSTEATTGGPLDGGPLDGGPLDEEVQPPRGAHLPTGSDEAGA